MSRMTNPWLRKAVRMSGKTTLPSKKMFRDSDGDGVKDVFDCQPHNPKKQGFIHRMGKAIVEKTTRGELREDLKAGITRREELSEAKTEARHEAQLEYVREREKIKTKRRLDAVRTRPSMRKVMLSGLDSLTRPPKRRTTPAPRTTRRKKGKTKKRKKTTATTQTRQRFEAFDF